MSLELGLLVIDHVSHDLGNCLKFLALTLVARYDKSFGLDD